MLSCVAALLLLAAGLSAAQSSSGSVDPEIIFSSPPPLPTPVSRPRNSSNSLGGYYSLAGGVINTIRPGKLPHDTIAVAIASANDKLGLGWGLPPPPDTDAQGLANEFLVWLAPAIVAVGLGLLLAVVFPCVGCCILYCRKKGRCGAKSRIYRKKHHNIKCFVYTGFFLFANTIILVGAILGVFSVKHLSSNLGQLHSTVDSVLNDVSNYLDGGVDQVEFIADNQFGVLESYVIDDLDHIGEWFEGQIGDDIQSDADAVTSNATYFLETLISIENLTVDGNALIGGLKTVTADLTSQVVTLNESVVSLGGLCTAAVGSSCDFISSVDFGVTVNYTDIGDIEFNSEIDLDAIAEQVKNATDIFRDLSHFIDSEAENYGLSDTAESEFQKAHETIQDEVSNAINKTLDDITSDDGIIGGARAEVDDALKYLDTYEAYWFATAIVLMSLFFLMVALFLTGSFFGSFGYSRVAQPHSRSTISHWGGKCILVGVILAFVSSPLLLIVTSASYGLATGVQKVCDDLRPPDYSLFHEVADNPSVWGGYTLVGVITRETVAKTVNLSITQTLSECSQNEPIWRVLDGDDLFNLTVEDSFNCSLFGVGTDEFLPFDGFNSGDIFPNLTDISGSYDFNFERYKSFTNDTILSFNLTELEANLMELQTAFNMTEGPSGEGYNLTTQILSDLENVKVSLDSLQNLQMYVEGNVTELETRINTSQSELSDFSGLVDAFLDKLPTVVNNAANDYIDRLCGLVDEYIDYALDAIKNEVGRCSILPVAYSALHSEVCENTLDGLNGYWFSTGWCVLFSVLAVILGLVLSDYFRRAGTRVVKCTDTGTSSENTSLIPYEDDENVSVIQMNHNHTAYAPSHPNREEQQPLHTTQLDTEW